LNSTTYNEKQKIKFRALDEKIGGFFQKKIFGC
jgi:hypothetical protein